MIVRWLRGLTGSLRSTAAWRISAWTTLVFAVGCALAFAVVQLLVARTIRQRSDAWLSGEAEVLAQVARSTPRGHLYDRVVEEMAELAAQELPDERNTRGQRVNSVFFLATGEYGPGPVWVGPGRRAVFQPVILQAHLRPGIPRSIYVEGWKAPFRVVLRADESSPGAVYLGLSDQGASDLLRRLGERFLLVWAGVVLLGFLTAFASAHRTLQRVEGIAEAVARIGSDDLSRRLPEGRHPDEISRLSSTFNHMLHRIETSVGQLRSVTQALAHDLKSPVTSIRGRIEMALASSDDDTRQEVLAQAIEHLDRLSAYLNTTLDLAEAEAGALRLQRESADLGALAQEMVDLYGPAFAEYGHELCPAWLPDPVPVEVDVGLIHRVLSNLLDNELRHLPGPCRVTITVETSGGMAQLVIEDNGPGFPADLRERAFQRFVRGSRSDGYGLGLAFVDAAVQAHGGSIHLSDRAGGGARIVIRLPHAWNA